MTAGLFARFILLYIAKGKNINVKLEDNSTFLDLVSEHRKSTAYVTVLEEAGAVRSKHPG